MTQGPWSVKGIDPKARSVARERAQRQGVTLGQYLNSLLLEGDEGIFEEVDLAAVHLDAGVGLDLAGEQQGQFMDQRVQLAELRPQRGVQAPSRMSAGDQVLDVQGER